MNKDLKHLLVLQDLYAEAIDSCKTGEQAGLMKALEMLEDYIREQDDAALIKAACDDLVRFV